CSVIRDLDDGALPRRFVDREADGHRIEHVALADFRLAAAENRVEEGRDEIALLGSRIGVVEQDRLDIGRARAPDPAIGETILEARRRAIDEQPVEMREDAGEIGGDLADQSALEAQYGDDHIVEAKAGARRRDAIAEGRHFADALAGEPGDEIDDMDAAAQHHRIEILPSSPAIDDLVDAAVVVVPLQVEEPPELAGGDACLEGTK